MMQRFALILLLSLSIQYSVTLAESPLSSNLRAAGTGSHAKYDQRRQLAVSEWFSSLYTMIHCPPGHHHKECMSKHSSNSHSGSSSGSHSSSSSGTGSSSNNSSGSNSNTSGGSSSSSNGGGSSSSSNGGGGGGNDDNYSTYNDDNNNNDDSQNVASDDDDGDVYITWSGDGYPSWSESNLDSQASSSAGAGTAVKTMIPLMAAALIAGVFIAAYAVGRRRGREEAEGHPLEGSLKKRMKLFSGGVVQTRLTRTKSGRSSSRNVPLNDDESDAPNFIEIASLPPISSNASGGGNGRSYRAPKNNERPSLFQGDSMASDESEI